MILTLLAAVRSEAQTYTVPSPNGLITLQATLSGAGSGLSDLQFNGNSQLAQQWFYYSVGSDPVNSIDQIAAPSSINNHGGAAPFLSAVYSNASLSVTAKFQLNNAPTLTETLTIANTSSSSETVHFYQYSHFELGGVVGGQNVQFSNSGSGPYFQVNQTGAGGVSLQGVMSGASAPNPLVQAGVGTQFGLMNGNPAPMLDNATLAAGPGDVSYAYEWDITLGAAGTLGSSFQLSDLQTLTPVPEPTSEALMATGMLLILYRYGRKSRRNG